MRKLASFLLALACFGQISAPRVGFVRDRAGALRPVHGIAGNFMLGDPVATGVISAAFSKEYGLAKTADEILVIRGGEVRERYPAPEGLASFGFSESGAPNWVRLANGDCLIWKAGAPEPGECPASEPEATVSSDELVLTRWGIRLRVAPDIKAVEAIGPGWLAVETPAGLYAVRTEDGREALFALPEVEQ